MIHPAVQHVGRDGAHMPEQQRQRPGAGDGSTPCQCAHRGPLRLDRGTESAQRRERADVMLHRFARGGDQTQQTGFGSAGIEPGDDMQYARPGNTPTSALRGRTRR